MEGGAHRPRLEEGLCPSQAYILLSGQGCNNCEKQQFPVASFFLFFLFFQAVLMGRGNKAQPTATHSRTAGAAQASSAHTFILSFRAWASEPLSHLPCHRVGSTACSGGLLQQNVYSLVTSSPQRQKGAAMGLFSPSSRWLMGFEGLEKPREKMGQ